MVTGVCVHTAPPCPAYDAPAASVFRAYPALTSVNERCAIHSVLDGHVELPAGRGISITDDEDERYLSHTPLKRPKLTVNPLSPLRALCGDRQPVRQGTVPLLGMFV